LPIIDLALYDEVREFQSMRSRLSRATFFVVCSFAVVVSGAVQQLPLTEAQANEEAVRRWGPTGSIRESQTGTTGLSTYEAGLQTKYGFEPRGRGTGNWANAFSPLPMTSFNTPLTEPLILRVGRIQVARNPDVNPNPILRIGENADHRAEAEERLSKFVEAVCSIAPQSCDAAGGEFRVRVVK
jgi:hypothetical protein